MSSPRSGFRRGALLASLVVSLFVAAPAGGQSDVPQTIQVQPKFPDAVTSAPVWLLRDEAPFDLTAYFDTPPSDQNAAPLYLDALLEFSPDLASLFPPGPETEARVRAARERAARLRPVIDAYYADPPRLDRTAATQALRAYQPGFLKLGQAQERPMCVFETGVGILAILPHVQAAREVERTVALRTRLNLDRGAIDPAILDVGGVLRFSRDLQRRGPMITQLVHSVLFQALAKDAIIPILSAARLSKAQAQRLLRLLTDHEARSLDGVVEALKTEYITVRATLHDLEGKGEGDAAKRREELLKALPDVFSNPQSKEQAEAIRNEIDKATPSQFSEAVDATDRLYRELLAAAEFPDAERLAKSKTIVESFQPPAGAPGQLVPLLAADLTRMIEANTRNRAIQHGVQALATVRLWQIDHNGATPTDLGAAAREAGMPDVPIDPYSGQPLKLAVIDGQPVVYSIGKDGKDDGGRRDAEMNTKPGDLLFRLDPSAGPRR